eukprot:GEMP01012875.1.p1 GENE.GEMP01012875.1~~GEMP01012875.1.p1  ORF type:complete len:704 (+),score=118.79 GEMP01012875.1:551-2662(+)
MTYYRARTSGIMVLFLSRFSIICTRLRHLCRATAKFTPLCLLTVYCAAELPIHCLREDAYGDWQIYASTPSSSFVPCNHTAPNTNRQNMQYGHPKHNAIRFAPSIFLSLKPHGVATGPRSQSTGTWTTVYDEGMEIRFGGVSYFAFFSYDCLKNDSLTTSAAAASCGVREAGETDHGETPGYVSTCSRTLVGWARQKDSFFCWHANKVPSSTSESGYHHVVSPVASVVFTDARVKEKTTSLTVPARASSYLKMRMRAISASPLHCRLVTFVARACKHCHDVETEARDAHATLQKDVSLVTKECFSDVWGPGRDFVDCEAEQITVYPTVRFYANGSDYRELPSDAPFTQSVIREFLRHASTVCPAIAVDHARLLRDSDFHSRAPISNVRRNSLFMARRLQKVIALAVDTSGSEENILFMQPRIQRIFAPDVGTSGSEGRRQRCRKDMDTLPDNFDWRDQFGGQWDAEATNQGQCGSCYAISAAYVLQSRFQIALLRRGISRRIRLSPESVLTCGYYNQACDGGFPYLVGRHARDFGLADESCLPYTNGGNACESAQRCLKDNKVSFFAKDYGYVGEYYDNCNEDKMRREIYTHGPISVALDANDDLYDYINGIYRSRDDFAQKHATRRNASWEFTSHAVAIVGWGELEGEKYWIVRNSWGWRFGINGYMHYTRGVNDGGIEAQAVWIQPDMDRLMKDTQNFTRW